MFGGPPQEPAIDPTARESRRSRLGPPELVMAAGILALAAFLCVPTLGMLLDAWNASPFHGHAHATLAAALGVAWWSRRDLRAALSRPQPSPVGAPAVLAAGLFLVVTFLADVRFLAGLGVPLLLAAIAYALGGIRLVKPLGLPLLLLALMVPPPAFVSESLLAELRLLASQGSVALLQAIGQPVLAEGNRVQIPGHALFVADACSGLVSLLTLLPIACIVAHFASRGVWRRAALVAAAIPLALAANLGRVLTTILLATWLGPEATRGLLHEALGIGIYALSSLALVGAARALR